MTLSKRTHHIFQGIFVLALLLLLIPLFLEQNQKTKIYAQKELEEELKRLLYQWMIRSKSVKTILQAVGVCGVSGKNCGLMIAKLAETFRYKISGEY